MYQQLPRILLSMLLVGMWSASCGGDAPEPANSSPALTGPTAQAADVNSGASVALSATATDPDGDTLTYAWTQTPASPAGTFSDASSASPTWKAPEVTTATSFQLSLTVSDGKDGTAQGGVTVMVRPAATTNQPPVLRTGQPTAAPTSVVGAVPVQLGVEWTDSLGDTHTVAWTQTPASPAGSFNNASLPNAVWTAPGVTAPQRFTLQVTVTDDKGASVQGTVTVDVAPPVANNQAPTLTTPTATPSPVNSLQPTSLSVTASDPDGDPISYSWTQLPTTPAGTFSNASVANPTWTAPKVNTDTNFLLRATVTDGRGGSANKGVTVTVRAFVTTPPVLTAGPSASPTTIDEQTSTNLSVSASDADGDPLTYAWIQLTPASPLGTFSSTSTANPTWKAPNVNANGVYRLRVTVSDGQGGVVRGDVDITVSKVNQPPTVNATINGPTTLVAGDTGSFSISASDPDGDPLTYSWSQTAPATQGTFVSSQTAAAAQWFSPPIGAQTSVTLSVSVTDGQSTPTTRTITVPVTVPAYTYVQTIWNGACTSCHGTNGGLSLGASTSYANLVNANTSNAACTTLKRVLPGDPDNSALIRKMEGTACGGRMPANNTNYFTTNPGMVVRVRSWILAGALNN
jgi:hypothetical protein